MGRFNKSGSAVYEEAAILHYIHVIREADGASGPNRHVTTKTMPQFLSHIPPYTQLDWLAL